MAPTETDHKFYTSLKDELKSLDEVNEVTGISTILSLMPDYTIAKYSNKGIGWIKAYGANTNQGISRNYNEDRVAIILNIMRPK